MTDAKFVYCEVTDGGMEAFNCTVDNIGTWLQVSWMTYMCVHDDAALLEWMQSAKPGQYFDHRLGMCFCVTEWLDGDA